MSRLLSLCSFLLATLFVAGQPTDITPLPIGQPTYTGIAVDKKEQVYVIKTFKYGDPSIMRYSNNQWIPLSPAFPANNILKIQRTSDGVVAMGINGTSQEQQKIIGIWKNDKWTMLPVENLKGMIRDFVVDHVDQVWMTGQFRDDARNNDYHLACWSKEKLTVQGPPLTAEPRMQPFFRNGGKAIFATSATIGLQLYTPSEYKNTFFVFTGGDRWGVKSGPDGFKILQDVEIAGVGETSNVYAVMHCNNGKNNCIAAYDASWSMLPGLTSHRLETIHAIAFDHALSPLFAGKITNRSGDHVVLRWAIDKWQEYANTGTHEIQLMNFQNKKIFAITGKEKNKIVIVSPDIKEAQGDGTPTPPKTTITTTPPKVTPKDQFAREVLDICETYLAKEKMWAPPLMRVLEVFGAADTEKKKDSEAIGVRNAMNNLKEYVEKARYDLSAYRLGRNRLQDALNVRFQLWFNAFTMTQQTLLYWARRSENGMMQSFDKIYDYLKQLDPNAAEIRRILSDYRQVNGL